MFVCQELCGKGGVLLLAQTVLDVNVSPFFVESSAVVAAVSRMKSKVLSIVRRSDGYVLL